MKTFPQCRAATFALLMGLASTLAHAQPANPTAPPAAPAQSVSFSDGQLESFLAIQPGLQQVRTEYSALLEQTDDSSEAAVLQQEATEKMIGVIEEEGMEVDTYNQIAVALQQDVDLRTRIEAMLEQ